MGSLSLTLTPYVYSSFCPRDKRRIFTFRKRRKSSVIILIPSTLKKSLRPCPTPLNSLESLQPSSYFVTLSASLLPLISHRLSPKKRRWWQQDSGGAGQQEEEAQRRAWPRSETHKYNSSIRTTRGGRHAIRDAYERVASRP